MIEKSNIKNRIDDRPQNKKQLQYWPKLVGQSNRFACDSELFIHHSSFIKSHRYQLELIDRFIWCVGVRLCICVLLISMQYHKQESSNR